MKDMEHFIKSAIAELDLLKSHLLMPDSIEFYRVDRIIQILNSSLKTEAAPTFKL